MYVYVPPSARRSCTYYKGDLLAVVAPRCRGAVFYTWLREEFNFQTAITHE